MKASKKQVQEFLLCSLLIYECKDDFNKPNELHLSFAQSCDILVIETVLCNFTFACGGLTFFALVFSELFLSIHNQ